MTSPTDRPSKLRLDLRAADSLAAFWRALADGDALPAGSPAFLWETPEGECWIAAGSSARFAVGGPGRFAAAKRWILDRAERGAEEKRASRFERIAIAGFSFAETAAAGWGISDSALFLPSRVRRVDLQGGVLERILARHREDEGFAPADPLATLERAPSVERPEWSEPAWARAIQAALEEIDAGRIEKVVLARSREIESPRGWDLLEVYAAMREAYPSSYRFLLSDGHGSTFLGASPERLVSLRNGRVEAEAVAGTARCAADAGPAERDAAAAALFADPKERLEHALVLREIVAGLGPYCVDVATEPEPTVDTHRHLLHLRTRVTATAKPGTHVLDLVARLHPTPAVAGSPRAAALEFIREWEPRERGWYAGPIGWMNAAGDGDFTVGLRSALVRGDKALLFGGAGIVAGSDPAREWRECDAKMQAILDALSHG